MCILVRMARIWVSTLPKSHSFPSSRGRNPESGCFEDHYQTNLILHSRLPGIYSCTCEICIYDNRFPSIWGVSSLSTRNLIMHCTGIRCPQHSFSNGCAFYLFQSKISQLFLLKTAFLTSVGNAGCPHILATLHSLPERELEIKFLTCSVLSGTPFPPATALLC